MKRGRTTFPLATRRISTLGWVPNLSLRCGKATSYLVYAMYCVAKTLHLSARLPNGVFTASAELSVEAPWTSYPLCSSTQLTQLLRSPRRSSGRSAATFLFVCATAAVISSS